jgi:predicted enzyme related to lactoylglutathione lyase
MNPVVHFEMPYEDRARMVAFYQKTFGWKPQLMGPEMGDYAVMTTTEMDEKSGFPEKPGRINGGFFQRSDENKATSVVIAVEDIAAAIKKVKDAGCKIVGTEKPDTPMDIPGVGLYAGFIDTEGNRVSIIQPKGPMTVHG